MLFVHKHIHIHTHTHMHTHIHIQKHTHIHIHKARPPDDFGQSTSLIIGPADDCKNINYWPRGRLADIWAFINYWPRRRLSAIRLKYEGEGYADYLEMFNVGIASEIQLQDMLISAVGVHGLNLRKPRKRQLNQER